LTRRVCAGTVLEGGSIDVNGAGVVMTTEQCLLNPNRNPQLDRTGIEEHLKDYLGVEQVLWLDEGIAGDDTDGHIDDIARFVSNDTIVCVMEDDPADENYRLLKDNHERLSLARDARQSLQHHSASDARPHRWTRKTACPLPTPTSTSPTTSCSFPFTDTPTTNARQQFSKTFHTSQSHSHPLRTAHLGHGRNPLRHATATGVRKT
jgi:hypothetical protein